jgi:heparinase II/III-like protein
MPILPVPPAIVRIVWADVDVPFRARAEAERGSPWPVPLAHAYARYFRDGDREQYQRAVFARQDRLSRAAVLAAVTLDPAWVDEVADGVVLLCEQSSWCWPAHDDTFRRHGSVLPTVTDPYLDLGAGEVAGQLAWLDHLLGEQLDERVPGLRARIRYEVDVRVLTPFTARRDWHWLGLDGDVHNWSPWIHGNLLVAALRLVDDPVRRAALIGLVVEGLERYTASLPPDGAIDEGYSYWWNGAGRLLEALDLLAYAGWDVPDLAVPAVRATVAFPHRTHLGGGWYLNHADGPARPSAGQPWAVLHRAARRFADHDAEAHAAAHRALPPDEADGLGRLLRALTEPAWRAAVPGPSPLPRDVWFASTQVLVARPVAGSAAGLTLAVKGGHNGEHHNHNDVGSVVVVSNGVPVLVDPGRPTYTAQTFGPDRYAIWCMQSSWHNVPEIRGTPQSQGHGYAARDVAVVVDDLGSELSLELAGAYPRHDIRSWLRSARLDRDTGRITIRDTWELEPAAGPVLVHFVVAGEVIRLEPGRAEITALGGGGSIRLSWAPAGVPGTTMVRELDDPMLGEVWGDRLTRLALDVTALGPCGTIETTIEEHG